MFCVPFCQHARYAAIVQVSEVFLPVEVLLTLVDMMSDTCPHFGAVTDPSHSLLVTKLSMCPAILFLLPGQVLVKHALRFALLGAAAAPVGQIVIMLAGKDRT